ncbi:MAG: MAB_1171c family putative transporter [Thermomicrobiales bacterium]
MSALILSLVWGSLFWKLQTLRWRPRDTIQRSYCGALLALALALTIFHPPIYRAVDRFTGVPNFARLLGNSLGVVSAWAFQPVITKLLRYQARGRGILGSAWLMIGTLGVMTFLFSRMSVPQSAPLDFQQRYGAAPFVAEYRIVLFAYIGLTMYNLFALSLRNGRVVRSISQPHRRLWARLQTFGWGLGTAYDANECIYVVLRRSKFAHNAPYDHLLANVLLTGFLVTILSGAGLGLFHWLGQYRALRQLYPLWRDLYRATPQIALYPPSSEGADIVAFRDVGFRLYRRVTEIHDGITALEPYGGDASMVERADGAFKQTDITRKRDRTKVEALMLARAMQAKRRGERISEPLSCPIITTEENLEHEVRHLKGVARAYRNIPAQWRETQSNVLSDRPNSREAASRR